MKTPSKQLNLFNALKKPDDLAAAYACAMKIYMQTVQEKKTDKEFALFLKYLDDNFLNMLETDLEKDEYVALSQVKIRGLTK
jgi:hypothetical protein